MMNSRLLPIPAAANARGTQWAPLAAQGGAHKRFAQ
jgi:hypothetical protein